MKLRPLPSMHRAGGNVAFNPGPIQFPVRPRLPLAIGAKVVTLTPGRPERVRKVVNIHIPSILPAGDANTELNVGAEGRDVAIRLNDLGMSAFIPRYRLRPYSSNVDARADTQRSARADLNVGSGNAHATDPVDQRSDRPDFVVLVYADWGKLPSMREKPRSFIMHWHNRFNESRPDFGMIQVAHC